ncbi:thioredoxin-2-like [Lucilia sericata]|uniref:thioredoxin-2-like n=1 Tax=Lucilia sericata TaxID=13632 RepID=UPI0018A80414|nr:thioredoxin-2-like [Lucilia sericata]
MTSNSKNKTTGSTTKQRLSEDSTTVNITSNINLLILANKNDFYKILKETNNRLLVIEFFAHWCGPCKILASKLEQVAEAYKGKILIVKVDVDEFEDLAMEYDVSAMPTFMLMKNQQKLEQFSSSNAQTLDQNLEKYAGKPELSGNGKGSRGAQEGLKDKDKQKRGSKKE